ncbi:MAG: prepilin-type N-terminal cleavage/methylation domain-containing protein [Planctomycetota bacterium]|jgi:prepilin-type N-terminal cleavage/methylation domain-containing protein
MKTYNKANKMKDAGRFSRKAFTLVELLLALAITGLLVATIAFAFDTSIKNYNANEDIFNAMNLARQTLFRITAQLRTADPCSVDPYAPLNECTLNTQDDRPITYSYNSTDKKLYLITNDDPDDQDYVLCENVESLTFKKETAIDPSDNLIYVKNVLITMEVQVGSERRKLSSAAVNRRNLVR